MSEEYVHTPGVMRRIAVYAVMLTPPWMMLVWWAGYPMTTVFGVALLGMHGLLLWWVSRPPRSERRSVALLVSIVASISYVDAVNGLSAGASAWFCAMPVLAMVLGDRRMGQRAIVLTALGVGLVVWWTVHAGHQREWSTPVVQGLAIVVAAWFLFLAADRQDTLMQRNLERSHALNEQLQAELAEHQKTRAALEHATTELMTTAHQAGMADIATTILHDLGNALNGVSVSATLARKSTPGDRVGRLHRVADRLRSGHSADKVANYLDALADRMVHDEHALVAELDHLAERVEHVATIISAQQLQARSKGLARDVDLRVVVEQAMSLVAEQLRAAGVGVQVDVWPVEIHTHEHKLLQVLTNLLMNARDALVEGGGTSLQVECMVDTDRIHLRVVDDGVGIAADVLPRIFEHGFTTKPNGHGFGLHGSALAARDLGGTLTVASDGVGRGATFVLELPRMTPSRTPVGPPRRRHRT